MFENVNTNSGKSSTSQFRIDSHDTDYEMIPYNSQLLESDFITKIENTKTNEVHSLVVYDQFQDLEIERQLEKLEKLCTLNHNTLILLQKYAVNPTQKTHKPQHEIWTLTEWVDQDLQNFKNEKPLYFDKINNAFDFTLQLLSALSYLEQETIRLSRFSEQKIFISDDSRAKLGYSLQDIELLAPTRRHVLQFGLLILHTLDPQPCCSEPYSPYKCNKLRIEAQKQRVVERYNGDLRIINIINLLVVNIPESGQIFKSVFEHLRPLGKGLESLQSVSSHSMDHSLEEDKSNSIKSTGRQEQCEQTCGSSTSIDSHSLLSVASMSREEVMSSLFDAMHSDEVPFWKKYSYGGKEIFSSNYDLS